MANFTVTTLADETFQGSETTGAPDGAGLSLREALALANANADADAISFAAGLSGGTLTLTNGELTISTDVAIDGDVNGDGKADITISGNDASRIFLIAGAATDADLKSLTLTDGNGVGGGVGNGGAIYAGASSVDIVNTTIRDSTAAGFGGGAYFLQSTSTLTNSLVVGNHAAVYGGGLSAASGPLTL